MSKLKTKSIFINEELKKLIIRLTFGFLLVFILSFIATCMIYIHNMNLIAESISKSTHNNIILGEYRDAKTILNQALFQGFNYIELIDKNNADIITLNNDNHSIQLNRKIIISIRATERSKESSKIIFKYSILNPIKKTLIFWLLFIILLMPIVYFLNNRLMNFYENKYKEQSLIELGNLTRQVAHDLRSPISGLKILTKTIQFNNSKEKRLFEKIIDSISQIASDILNQNKVNRDSANIKKIVNFSSENSNSSFAPTNYVKDVLDVKENEYLDRKRVKLTLEVSKEAENCSVLGNPNELKRILSNLINNSYEAIESSGLISLSMDIEEDHYFIEIRDTGKGIPIEIIDRVSKEEITFGKTNGNGLGLFAARKIIETWKGKLKIFSRSGQGTTVRIELPIVSAYKVS